MLWATRRQPASLPPVEAAQQKPTPRILPPSFDNSFDDEPELTAVPHVSSYRLAGADDYESLGPDELSMAFLSRATESWSKLEEGDLGVDGELQGFQVATIEDLTVPELSDELADFEVPNAQSNARNSR